MFRAKLWRSGFLAAFCGLSFVGAASADELILRDGKAIVGRLVDDAPDAIEFEPEGGKAAKHPKSKVARVIVSYSKGRSAPAAADASVVMPAADAKGVIYEDRSLGAAFEMPKEWIRYAESKRGRLVMGGKKREEGELLVKASWTLEELDPFVARVRKEEIGKLEGSVVKEEAAPAAAKLPQKRLLVDYKEGTAKKHRDYIFVRLPGRILTFMIEAPPAGAKFVKQKLEGAFASVAETEPEWALRYDQDGFGLAAQPEGSLLFKGFEMHKGAGGVEGRRYAWFSQKDVSFAIDVYTFESEPDAEAMKAWFAKEYENFTNVKVVSKGQATLGGMEAQTAVTERDGENGKKHQQRVTAFADGKRVFALEAYFFDTPKPADERAYDQLLAVFRTTGMARARK
ncbi:MAG: hypothetical protein JNJ88_00855 [Planctomycetes bacterium]|nr:hypothetical protein [Planctomycetota bacterium]